MYWLVGLACYLLAHLAMYSVFLRRSASFAREGVILLYHAISAMALAIGAALALVLRPAESTLMVAVAMLCLHGIYSMSFLEIWALAEGGYSLSILRAVGAARSSGSPLGLGALSDLGDTKRAARAQHLVQLGFVRQRAGTLELTVVGRLVANCLYGIRLIANLREIG